MALECLDELLRLGKTAQVVAGMLQDALGISEQPIRPSGVHFDVQFLCAQAPSTTCNMNQMCGAFSNRCAAKSVLHSALLQYPSSFSRHGHVSGRCMRSLVQHTHTHKFWRHQEYIVLRASHAEPKPVYTQAMQVC